MKLFDLCLISPQSLLVLSLHYSHSVPSLFTPVNLDSEEMKKERLIYKKQMLSNQKVVKKKRFTLKDGLSQSPSAVIVANADTASWAHHHCIPINVVVNYGLLSCFCPVKTVNGLTEEQHNLLKSIRSQTIGYLGQEKMQDLCFLKLWDQVYVVQS